MLLKQDVYKKIEAKHQKDIIILKENWEVIDIWLQICYLWDIQGMSGTFISLKWHDVKAKIDLMECKYNKEIIAGITIMEISSLSVLNAKDK